MALKDAAGLVKMYAMVNVQQYQIVATGNTVADCQRRYHELLVENQILSDEEIAEPEPEEKAVEVSGKVEEIRSADMDGNTVYFIRLEKGKAYYMVSAKDYPEAVILDVGDDVTVTHYPTEDELIEAVSFEMKK